MLPVVWADPQEEPTPHMVTSRVLRNLDRPPNPASRVEFGEAVRCNILNALEAGLKNPSAVLPAATHESSGIRVRPLPDAFAPTEPAPWLPAPAPAPVVRRRRSLAPLATALLALAITAGLWRDSGARVRTRDAFRAQLELLVDRYAP